MTSTSWPSFYRVRSFFLSSLSHTASHVNTYGHSCTHLHRHFASQRFSLFATHLSVYQTSMTTAHRQRPLLQIHSFLFQRCHLLQLNFKSLLRYSKSSELSSLFVRLLFHSQTTSDASVPSGVFEQTPCCCSLSRPAEAPWLS